MHQKGFTSNLMQEKDMKTRSVVVSVLIIAAVSSVTYAGSENADGETKEAGTETEPDCDYIAVPGYLWLEPVRDMLNLPAS